MNPRLLAPFLTLLFSVVFLDFLCGQNIVETVPADFTANPATLTDRDVSESFCLSPNFQHERAADLRTQTVQARLQAHVQQLLQGEPWKPLHHTLGISGYEPYFNHPDELFYTLSMALPWVSPETAASARQFLRRQLSGNPPYALEGYDPTAGRGRESYDVPPSLRLSGRGKARSCFGVYSFWAYCHYGADAGAARDHWTAVKERVGPLLSTDYRFDVHKKDYTKDEAEKLNGDLAGLIGLYRLAQLNGDPEVAAKALSRGRQLLELRVNLERVNPKILEKTASASKGLHNYKLARFCSMPPEVAEAVRRHSAGCGAAHLKAFREERNGWYMAFGDRLIGGENYTNPLHFPRALFTGATLIERLDPAALNTLLDVPWCQADLYYVEKCVLAIWAAHGLPWKDLCQ